MAVSDIFSTMQNDYEELVRKAVKAAISMDWTAARDYNLQILEQDENNLDAKVRLGKAYLELRDYNKARKCFKDVLALDPINSVAKKNLELATEQKHHPASNGKLTNIIQEPATFIQVSAEISAKGFTATKIPMGADLEVKVLSHLAKLYYVHKNQKLELAIITDPKVTKKLKAGKDSGASFTGTFFKGSEKNMIVLIKSSLPIFEGERQELKPYTKRDFLDSESDTESSIEES